MKIGKYFNMKILNIHNIFLTKSLRGIAPNSAKYHAYVHGMLSNSHGYGWDFHVRQISMVIFRAAGMCNGRERSGRERRNWHCLPQAILTLTDEEWDGEAWLSSFRLLWSVKDKWNGSSSNSTFQKTFSLVHFMPYRHITNGEKY